MSLSVGPLAGMYTHNKQTFSSLVVSSTAVTLSLPSGIGEMQ